MKTILNVISKSFSVNAPNTYFREVLELMGSFEFKCQIEIRTHTFASNSYARIKVWSFDSLQWNLVHELDPQMMKTDNSWPGDRKEKITHKTFAFDRNELIRVAKKILNLC